MDFEFSVCPEQLLASAATIQAMADDCAGEPTAVEPEPASPAEPQPSATSKPDELGGAATDLAASYRDAMDQVSAAMLGTAETLRATALDYQRTEALAEEMIRRGLASEVEQL